MHIDLYLEKFWNRYFTFFARYSVESFGSSYKEDHNLEIWLLMVKQKNFIGSNRLLLHLPRSKRLILILSYVVNYSTLYSLPFIFQILLYINEFHSSNRLLFRSNVHQDQISSWQSQLYRWPLVFPGANLCFTIFWNPIAWYRVPKLSWSTLSVVQS